MTVARRTPPNTPRPVRVHAAGGIPITVDGNRVEAVRNDWLIEDRWWTRNPLRRRYWEVLTSTGRCLVLFHDLETHRWYGQGG
jgi:hypothetical protein